jgi:Fe-S-cluster-containing dehydrogenase component
MNMAKKERGVYPYIKVAYMPMPCYHCGNAPCLKAARGGAIRRKRNGIVIIDPQKAVGQKQIVQACPYGAIFWNEEKSLPQKCTFCAHRLDEGKAPRCVQVCPSGCLTFGDLEDPESEVARLLAVEKAEVFHPEWGTRPNVYYVNLQKATRNFLAGAVVLGDVNECAKGASVTLVGPNGEKAKTRANAFGNFELDGLVPGRYVVNFESPGYKAQSLSVEMQKSEYLGDINLNRA